MPVLKFLFGFIAAILGAVVVVAIVALSYVFITAFVYGTLKLLGVL